MSGGGRRERTRPLDPGAADDLLAGLDGFSRSAHGFASRVRGALASLPWWVQVGLVWLVSRLFVAGWTVVALSRQASVLHLESVPGNYFEYASIWDGTFYRSIHDGGYPGEIVIGEGGAGRGGEWAFLPVYPLLVRVVTALTPLGWPVAATTVSLLVSLGFLLIAYRLFVARTDDVTALAAIALLSFSPAAAVLQYAYAESLGLFLVALALLLMSGGRYALAGAVVVLAALTRPLGVPLFVAVCVIAVTVAVAHRRSGGPVPVRSWWSLGGLVAAAALGAVLWPILAAAGTGLPAAYLRVEGAWHGGVHPPLYAFLGSLVVELGRPAGLAVAIVVVVGFVMLMLSRAVRRLGMVMWAWVGAVLGYLILLTPVSSSTPRLLLSAFPLALAAAGVSRSRWYRGLLIVLLAVLQAGYILVLWHLRDGITDHSP